MVPDPLIKDLDFTFNPNEVNDDDDDEAENAMATTLGNGGGIFNTDNLNPFSYGYNNPIKFDDPDGRCPSCLFGALLEAGVDYGIQVAANYASGKRGVDAWTKDISLSSIALSAAEGALTQGAGAARKFAVKGAVAIAKNTIDYNSSTGLKVETSTKNIIKNTIVDKAAGGVAKKVGGVVEKVARKSGVNGGAIAKVVKQELRNNNVRVTRNLNQTIKSVSNKVNPAIKKTAENASTAVLQKPVDKLKNKTNE